MSRVFAVLREEAEASSELKNVSGKETTARDQLTNANDDIIQAISSFDEARISDIENERLPPELVDASEVEGFESFGSPGHSPRSSADFTGMFSPPRVSSPSADPGAMQQDSPLVGTPTGESYPSSPIGTPSSPSTSGNFRKGHGRQSSLGTTMTSPSTRRRSLESTVSMIVRVVFFYFHLKSKERKTRALKSLHHSAKLLKLRTRKWTILPTMYPA